MKALLPIGFANWSLFLAILMAPTLPHRVQAAESSATASPITVGLPALEDGLALAREQNPDNFIFLAPLKVSNTSDSTYYVHVTPEDWEIRDAATKKSVLRSIEWNSRQIIPYEVGPKSSIILPFELHRMVDAPPGTLLNFTVKLHVNKPNVIGGPAFATEPPVVFSGPIYVPPLIGNH